ncbi:MAG: NFACT family protein, partial [Clostridia bacterium]|nr:NFACT family protein [Clostridia bacterium]
MGSDLFALSALANELNQNISGARIDKIQQPEADELRFFMRANGKNVCLVASCNAAIPRLHLTTSRKQSPQLAPNFCMLLRKYLSSASVDSVGVYNADRILYVKFNAKTEMRDDAQYFLFVEIMNRYSNIVFTDSNLIILDAIKHLPLDIARDHVVMRGVKYSPVAQRKISYLNDCFSILEDFQGGDLHKYIQANISGFSGTTVSELLARASLSHQCDKLNDDELQALKNVIDSFRNPKVEPCVINGEAYPIPYKCLSGVDNAKAYSTMSEAYDALNTDIDAGVRNRARLKALSTAARRLHTRVEKNIAIDLEHLKECENMDTYRVYGELVVNNIYKIKRGDSVLRCFNYYDNSDVDIPLDPQLSPSKNSSAYYNKYNKLKRTKEFVEKKLIADKNLLNYVCSIEEEISSLPFDASIVPIEEELAKLNGVKQKATKNKVRKEQAEPPYVYLVDGFYIYRLSLRHVSEPRGPREGACAVG